MDEEGQPRSLMFLITYLLLKRRRDLNNSDSQRRNEIQRRIRHRQYFFQRQRRMIMMMLAGGIRSDLHVHTRPWTTTLSTDWWERVVMNEFQPSDWLNKFRMSREDTFFYLCERLRPRLARQDTSFRLALPVEKRVAVALWRLASNVEYRTISGLFGVGKSTVCRCVRDLCHAIVALLSSVYLQAPTEQQLADSAQLFLSNWGFPHCVAAIATLHTAIITPSNNPSDYANPAGGLSVMSQVAVNGWGQFWDVCASFPGGTDPAEILQNSSLWAAAADGGFSPATQPPFMGKALRYVLLGEACYPVQSWLMTAYHEDLKGRRASHSALTGQQRLFNRHISTALRVPEDTLLKLRARWQCLSKRNDCGLDVVPTMVLACCILHNMCESHGDAFKEEWQVEVTAAESPQPHHKPLLTGSFDQSHAEEVRKLFCDYFEQVNNGKVACK